MINNSCILHYDVKKRMLDKLSHNSGLKCIGKNGMLLKLIKSFLENKFQRVVVNGQTSSWVPVLAGIPLF